MTEQNFEKLDKVKELLDELKMSELMAPLLVGNKSSWIFENELKRTDSADIKLDEELKPEVQQCAADWYEDHKGNLEYNLYLYQMSIYDEKVEKDDFYYWMQKSKNPVRTLINMHQFGYTIKKEKLYTVEIPNPNAPIEYHSKLAKNHKGDIVIEVQDWLNRDECYQLTESEIRKDFDWAWQFAKEVE